MQDLYRALSPLIITIIIGFWATPSLAQPQPTQAPERSIAAEGVSAGVQPDKMGIRGQTHMVGSAHYTLGPEDVIEIDVARHSEFSGVYTVSLDGDIQYSFVGDINVSGLTKGQLEEKIKAAIATYVVSPEVHVTIAEFKSKAFYVLGEVASPGKYMMRSETIMVSEAVLLAGLPTAGAAMHKARIITPGVNGSTTREVDLYSLLYAGNLNEDVVLNAGDYLYVPAAVTESVEKRKEDKDTFDSSQYTLGPEDVVEISVARHPDFSGTYPVSMEGKLQYKFVGDINVTGMTKEELEEKIKTVLASYVASPEVSVTITGFNSKVFYVLGEVASPGKYTMRSESITVNEAVLLAGLPTDAAAMRKARIVTPGADGGTTREVDLYALLYGGALQENSLLKPGDTLYVSSAVRESMEEKKQDNEHFDPLRYTLGPEDVVEISVMSHPDFSGTYPVSMEGKIQYRFVGDINVTGMTKEELEEKIRTVLASYVASPEVNVTVTEFNSKAFYVLGF